VLLQYPGPHGSCKHSFTSVQVVPFPENPLWQVQVYDPTVLLQAAFALQVFNPLVHSLTSVHVIPFPENPLRQVHVYDPNVFVHIALELQLLTNPGEHSLISLHVYPFPV